MHVEGHDDRERSKRREGKKGEEKKEGEGKNEKKVTCRG